MRRFYFQRNTDVSGVSGTGRVCDGLQFDDGKVAVRWLTPMASLEVWDSVEDCIKVHGHDGATQLVWIDEKSIQKSFTRDELFGELVKARDIRSEVSELVQLLKSNSEECIYISGDADNLGNQVAQVESKDDENALKDLSQRINAGQELFRRWIEALGGEVVEQGGDEFLGKISSIDNDKLEKFRTSYEKLVGASLTVGVGQKISQATRARMLGKLTGKNKLVTWEPSLDQELDEALRLDSKESQKLVEAGLSKAEGPGSRGGQVIGSTPSGKPIYSSAHHPSHQNFTATEHYHAMRAHAQAAKKFPSHSPEKMHHLRQQVLHTYKMSKLDGSDPHFYIPKTYYKEVQPKKDEAKKSEVAALLDLLEKSSPKGPGSKGGQITGYTPGGKPKYLPRHFSIISAQTGKEHSEERHQALKRDLESHGYKPKEGKGKWGYEEKNWIIQHKGTKEDHEKINALGKKHSQEAVFHRTGNKNRVDFMGGSPSHHGEGYSEGQHHQDHYTHWPDGRKFQFPVHEPKKD